MDLIRLTGRLDSFGGVHSLDYRGGVSQIRPRRVLQKMSQKMITYITKQLKACSRASQDAANNWTAVYTDSELKIGRVGTKCDFKLSGQHRHFLSYVHRESCHCHFAWLRFDDRNDMDMIAIVAYLPA